MTDSITTKKTATAFGKFLHQRRGILGLTLVDVAKRLTNAGWKISHPTIAHWESSTDPNMPKEFFNPTFINALAQALETTPAIILKESGMLEGIGGVTIDADDTVLAAIVVALENMSPEHRQMVLEIVQRFSRK